MATKRPRFKVGDTVFYPSAGVGAILAVEDIKVLLATALNKEPTLIPYLALGLFAGIRPEELQKLLARLKKSPLVKKAEEEQEARNNWARQRAVQGYE